MKTKLGTKLGTKRFVILFFTAILIIVSTLFGVQAIKANADTGVIKLSIYSQYGDNTSKQGHSWLVIENGTSSKQKFFNVNIFAGESFSIGTHPSLVDPRNNKVHKGAWLNIEAYQGRGSVDTHSLTMVITVEQLATVSAKCLELDDWGTYKNCSYFAAAVWNTVAPKSMEVSAYSFPWYTPSALKKSIGKISGYEINRGVPYNDYTGYCPDGTYFKEIDASTIKEDGSSSSSLEDEYLNLLDEFDIIPEEFDTFEKFEKAYQTMQS